MSISKLLPGPAGLLAVMLIGAIGRLSAHVPPEAYSQGAAQDPKAGQQRLDRWGDPLPPGAIARLGTMRFRTGGSECHGLGFLPDSKTLVSGIGGYAIQFWEASTGKLLRELSTGNLAIRSFALSPNGKHLAVSGFFPADENGRYPVATRIWDTASGQEVRTFQRKDSNAHDLSMTFTPDGKLLISLAENGIVRVEEVATGMEVLRRQFEGSNGGTLALSPDGSILAVSTGDGNPNRCLYLWRWQAAEEPRVLPVPKGRVGQALAFSPDGKMLAESGHVVEAIRVWDVASGKLLEKLQPPDLDSDRPHWHACVAFTADNRNLIALTRTDGTATVHLWDAVTWKYLRPLNAGRGRFANWLGGLCVSPDSKTIAARCRFGGVVHVWISPPARKWPTATRRTTLLWTRSRRRAMWW
jgi:WD40 repeat protein